MKATTILAIVTIITALGAVTSLILYIRPVRHQGDHNLQTVMGRFLMHFQAVTGNTGEAYFMHTQ